MPYRIGGVEGEMVRTFWNTATGLQIALHNAESQVGPVRHNAKSRNWKWIGPRGGCPVDM